MALYTGLHGAYGVAWCLKELTFPDPNWDRYVTFGTAAAGVFGILLPYWVAPYLLARDVATGGAAAEASPAKMTACTLAFVLGVVMMTGADAQKYFVLKEKQRAAAAVAAPGAAAVPAAPSTPAAVASSPAGAGEVSGESKQSTVATAAPNGAATTAASSKRLISDGFFALVRHPNYLGEMLLYGAFAALSGRREPWYILLYVWTFVFLPNMLQKEVSMSRYPEWPSYYARTGMLIPKGWPRAVLVGLAATGAALFAKSRAS
jgi:steroid 5-alpha reductase family enzyme